MRILQLVPGTGNFYCGSCLRDNALVHGLRAAGHDVLMVPLYLPLVTDEPAENDNVPIFLSGISVFLEQKFSLFRHSPDWFNRLLSSPRLLRFSANFAGMTTARDLGESAVSMLQGEASHQAREMDRLIDWLRTQGNLDVICLSNSLLSGMAHRLKQEFRVPVVSTMQGEDSFLDSLTDPYRKQSWDLLAQRCADVDHFISVSQYYSDLMRRRLSLAPDRVTVVYPGVAVEDFASGPAPIDPPVIGYLARMHHGKGLATLVDAFLKLKEWNRVPGVQLRIAGAKTSTDNRLVDSLQQRLSKIASDVEFLPNLERSAKLELLRGLSVLSVPATYGEAFGLYLLEAWASGVPVVQPKHGAFPELLAKTGGGVLCEPDDPVALADALQKLLLDPARMRQLGQAGRQAVEQHFTIGQMTRHTEELLGRVMAGARV
jgi:glycosyltransferase involved in cell wall biosynthesis